MNVILSLKAVFLLLIFCVACFHEAHAGNAIQVGISLLEPWKMKNNGKLEGPEIDLMNEIAGRMNAKVTFTVAPFKRLLAYMKSGKVDMMPGLLKKTDREHYIYFLEPPYKHKSNKVFYVLKGKRDSIRKYEDLYNLMIGVKIGANYFPQFDKDKYLKKDAVSGYDMNIKKLLSNRIDTFVITDSQGDYLIRKMGYQDEIEKAAFGFYESNPVYFGLSKKSPLVNQLQTIRQIIRNMHDAGETERIIRSYFTRHNLPVPEYN